MTETTMPPLGTGSVDLDALHAAAAKKNVTQADLAAAAEAATIRVAPAQAVEPAAAPADEPPAEAPEPAPPALPASK